MNQEYHQHKTGTRSVKKLSAIRAGRGLGRLPHTLQKRSAMPSPCWLWHYKRPFNYARVGHHPLFWLRPQNPPSQSRPTLKSCICSARIFTKNPCHQMLARRTCFTDKQAFESEYALKGPLVLPIRTPALRRVYPLHKRPVGKTVNTRGRHCQHTRCIKGPFFMI